MKVYDHAEAFLNLKCNLTWCEDTKMRDYLFKRYKLYSFAVPSVELTAEQMQLTADMIAERYNTYYKNLHLDFNPLYNVDAYETWTESKAADDTTDGKSSQYPMDSAAARDVVKNVQNDKHNETIKHTNRRYGNIGVTMSSQLIEHANKIVRDLISDYMAEFGAWFMINTWGVD